MEKVVEAEGVSECRPEPTGARQEILGGFRCQSEVVNVASKLPQSHKLRSSSKSRFYYLSFACICFLHKDQFYYLNFAYICFCINGMSCKKAKCWNLINFFLKLLHACFFKFVN